MKPIIWIQLLLFCVGTGQFRTVNAQKRDVRFLSRERIDSLINPPLMKEAEQIIRFDRTVQDIGTLTEDDEPKTYRFVCTNVSKKTVRLERVRTTCGCAVAHVEAGNIEPGGKRDITLVYNPKNHPGTVDTNAFVYLAQSEKAPIAKLTLIGNVLPAAGQWARYPYAMGKLRLKQRRMEFKEVAPGKRQTERILCGNSGEKPLRLSAAIIPGFATFRTEPEVINPGEEADIVITVDASKIPHGKGEQFSFPVIIEGLDARPSDRTLDIKVNCIK